MKTYEEMISKLADMYNFAERAGSDRAYERRMERADGFCSAIAMMFNTEIESVNHDACAIATH